MSVRSTAVPVHQRNRPGGPIGTRLCRAASYISNPGDGTDGYEWQQAGTDLLLVTIATGLIYEVLHDVLD